MPKTAPAGDVRIPGAQKPFRASAVPDAFDARDLEYLPRLQPLPGELDVRPADKANFYVMTQQGNSCTGHAVAAMINTVLARREATGVAPREKPMHVSPYMLYAMARRYDEFAGEDDEGSSLRGALKGWYYHGVLPESAWPALDPGQAPDIDEPALAELAMHEPLGTFYRVNAFRLDDMQSAVNELHSIVVSAAVHEGWVSPTIVARKVPGTRKAQHMAVIERGPHSRQLGGHAFAIVGYNEVGFLVQNSWGTTWGRNGFATLPYDDWLASAYDAWVARPGVRSIVSQRSHSRTVTATAGEVANGPGPDLQRLDRHVVNLGNDGKLSVTGRFSSTPAQIDRIFARMKDYHDYWADHPAGARSGSPAPRRIAIYAHGGLNSESTGLSIAWGQLNWWLNNHIYPITFAWQSGPSETLVDQLSDMSHAHLPAGGLGFDLVEQFDRLVEKIARVSARWMWDEMKENATKASKPFPAAKAKWPVPSTGAARQTMAALPGASLTASRLKAYVDAAPGPVEVHLVGHSAGSIFLGAMLDQLEGIPITSLSFMAPAIRIDTFLEQVVPHLGRHVAQFATFGLDKQRELDDVCGVKGRNIYQKSLLYLVSRALERSTDGGSEVPILGMERFVDAEVGGTTVDKAVHDVGGSIIWSPSERPANSRSDSTSHGGFDDDSATMTSVMLRALGTSTSSEVARFQPHAQRREPEPPGVGASSAGGTPELSTADVGEKGTSPTTRVAAAGRSGAAPTTPRVPRQMSANATVAALQRDGWQKSKG